MMVSHTTFSKTYCTLSSYICEAKVKNTQSCPHRVPIFWRTEENRYCYMIACINTNPCQVVPTGLRLNAAQLQHGQSEGSASCWGRQKMAPVQWTRHKAPERPLLPQWSNVDSGADSLWMLQQAELQCSGLFSGLLMDKTLAAALNKACLSLCWTNFRTTAPPVFPLHDPVFPLCCPDPPPTTTLAVGEYRQGTSTCSPGPLKPTL